MSEQLNGLRKSAIVLLSLGQQQAAELLRRLPTDAAEAVRQEMGRVGSLRGVSLPTRQSVLGQFCNATSPPGSTIDPPQPAGPFSAFHDAETQGLLDSVRQEHPQTIALVLAHLPPDKASEILAGLEHHKQVEVVKRIAGIEQTSAEVIEQVERGLRQRLSSIMGGTIRSGGVSAIAEILNSASPAVEDHILTELEADSPDLADQVRRAQSIFEDLLHAPDCDMRAVIEQLDQETISMALRTAGDELEQKVLWNMPREQAEQIEQELRAMEPVLVSEIESAQQRVAEVVHRLDAAGEIEVLDHRQREEA